MPANYEGKWHKTLKYNTKNFKGPNDLQIFSIGRAIGEKKTEGEWKKSHNCLVNNPVRKDFFVTLQKA